MIFSWASDMQLQVLVVLTKLITITIYCIAKQEVKIKYQGNISSHDSQFNSVTQSCLTLWPHGLEHARSPCPSPTPRACSNSCPSSQWCHPIISFSVISFSCLQSFAASESFPMSQFFASGGQSMRQPNSLSWFWMGYYLKILTCRLQSLPLRSINVCFYIQTRYCFLLCFPLPSTGIRIQ